MTDDHNPTNNDNPDDGAMPTNATKWPWVETESALASYNRVQAAMDARTNGGDA